MEAWEFEGYWYVQSPDSLPLCMNSREAVEYLRKLEAVADVARDVALFANTFHRYESGRRLADTLGALDGKVSK